MGKEQLSASELIYEECLSSLEFKADLVRNWEGTEFRGGQ